jgi:hypothetical protein
MQRLLLALLVSVLCCKRNTPPPMAESSSGVVVDERDQPADGPQVVPDSARSPDAAARASLSRTDRPLARPGDPVATEMRGLAYHVDDSTVLVVRYLRGALEPTRAGYPPVFDVPSSFRIAIDSAIIDVGLRDLERLLNARVFADARSSVHDVRVTLDGLTMRQRARFGSARVPVEITGTLSVSASGEIRMRADRVRAMGVGVTGLLRSLHVGLERLISDRHTLGLRVVGNDTYLDVLDLMPPPHLRARLARIDPVPEGLRLAFAADGTPPRTPQESLPDPRAPHYMYFSGGVLGFGKLTMTDARMQVVDADTSDLFDFDLRSYNEQLTAGFNRNLPDYGLLVVMKDLHDVRGSR